MDTKKEIGKLGVKENLVNNMQIREEIKASLKDGLNKKKRKVNLAMNSKTFEHHLKKMKDWGKEENCG